MSLRWMIGIIGLGLALAPASGLRAAPPRVTDVPRDNDLPPDLKKVESKYYWIYTDLDETATRELSLRLTTMAEEYARRTRAFSGAIRTKFPVYVFRKANDYYAMGGVPGSAGVYDSGSQRLMIIAGMEAGDGTWHTMQHEGFHQFAGAVIGGDLPAWVNEGLAEYFGEGVWTGDSFMTGLVPEWRFKRIRETMAADGFRPISEMLTLTLDAWNGNLSIQNYDQAWSMVHFLVHADDGKYRKAFANYMIDVGRGRAATKSWATHFGDPGDGFEQRWKAYWNDLPDDPTASAYATATTETIAAFWARALARKQPAVTDYASFVDAFGARKLTIPLAADDWLPPSLLAGAIKDAEDAGVVTLEPAAKAPPRVVLTCKDACRAVATIVLQNNKIKSITTTFDDAPKALAEAKRLHVLKEPAKANALLKDALKRNPDSPAAPEMREMLKQPAPVK
jgi:hypothetical protein